MTAIWRNLALAHCLLRVVLKLNFPLRVTQQRYWASSGFARTTGLILLQYLPFHPGTWGMILYCRVRPSFLTRTPRCFVQGWLCLYSPACCSQRSMYSLLSDRHFSCLPPQEIDAEIVFLHHARNDYFFRVIRVGKIQDIAKRRD